MGIRDTSYYGWQNIEIFKSTPIEEFDRRQYLGGAIHPINGHIYVCGFERTSGNTAGNWVVRRSKDGGESFETVDFQEGEGAFSQANALAIDVSGNIYVAGQHGGPAGASDIFWMVRTSATGNSGSFEMLDFFQSNGQQNFARGLALDSSGSLYVVGREGITPSNGLWTVRKSISAPPSLPTSEDLSASFVTIDSYNKDDFSDFANAIAIDSQDNVYVGGRETSTGTGTNWLIRSSLTGLSGSFSTVDFYDIDPITNAFSECNALAIDTQDNIYAVGTAENDTAGSVFEATIRKSTTGASASFVTIDSFGDNVSFSAHEYNAVAVGNNGFIYAAGGGAGFGRVTLLRKSITGASASFETIDQTSLDGGNLSTWEHVLVDGNENIYLMGYYDFSVGIIRRGRLTSNSVSLGPRMLASSIGFVNEEPVSQSFFSNSPAVLSQGKAIEKFKLNNITEFPHSQGVFQMPSLVVGTRDSGKVGNTDDSIIQVRYLGSVVKVMWPKQVDQAVVVKGFGDLSSGQRPGKLSSDFEPGDFIDVTEFDHMSLYCYLLKQQSGTLDNVDVRVERRPLRSTGFSTEQTIEYSSSGSVTVAELKDLVYRKQIDYGDLSIKEIGYPIDVPLTNVREVRISAKHLTGQSADDNKNLIIWGRFIKSDEET